MEMLSTHKMRRADRLEKLSAYYRVPVCMIMRANALTDAQEAQLGTKLKIPKKCFCNRCIKEHKADVRFEVYTVQPLDTLYSIARGHGVTMHIILKTNCIDDPDRISAGDQIIIPILSGKLYSVRSGETIEDIALAHDVSVGSIRQKNCLEKEDTAYPGLQLIIG